MPTNEQAMVSADGQDCFSARALIIDQQSHQELLHQLLRMALHTCLTSVLSGPEEQRHLSLMPGAGEEQKQQNTEGRAVLLPLSGRPSAVTAVVPQAASGTTRVCRELTGQVMPHPSRAERNNKLKPLLAHPGALLNPTSM